MFKWFNYASKGSNLVEDWENERGRLIIIIVLQMLCEFTLRTAIVSSSTSNYLFQFQFHFHIEMWNSTTFNSTRSSFSFTILTHLKTEFHCHFRLWVYCHSSRNRDHNYSEAQWLYTHIGASSHINIIPTKFIIEYNLEEKKKQYKTKALLICFRVLSARFFAFLALLLLIINSLEISLIQWWLYQIRNSMIISYPQLWRWWKTH